MKIPVFSFALFAIMLSPGIGGQVSYESLPEYKAPGDKRPGVIYRIADKAHQTILGFTLLQSSLADVKKSFNDVSEAPIEGFHHGTAVCISAAQANDDTKILFVKIPVADLHGFILLSGKSAVKAPRSCLPSLLVHKGIRTQSGIRIGMSKDEVAKTLGTPSSRNGSVFLYRFEMQTKFLKEAFEQYLAENKGADPATLYSEVRTDIKIEFVKDRLVSYSVSTSDTF